MKVKKPILEMKNITKSYRKGKHEVKALQTVSFQIEYGEIFGLVGESGSGKSTIAKLITRLENTDSGNIILSGSDITCADGRKLLDVYRNIQMVFQDPKSSFNNRIPIGKSISEGYDNLSRKKEKFDLEKMMQLVKLKNDYINRYPHELSGGECQRAAIARAIAVGPGLLICDEATSALDVSAQAQIVDLLVDLKEKMNMAILFISHDLALVSSICDRICVLHQGKVVERGKIRDIIDHPKADYTKKLISSVMVV